MNTQSSHTMGRTGLTLWTIITLGTVLVIWTLGGWAPVLMVPRMFIDALTVAGTWKYFLVTFSAGGLASALLIRRPTLLRAFLAYLVICMTAIAFAYFAAMLTPFGH